MMARKKRSFLDYVREAKPFEEEFRAAKETLARISPPESGADESADAGAGESAHERAVADGVALPGALLRADTRAYKSAHERANAGAHEGADVSAHERAGERAAQKAGAKADARAYKSAHERADAGAHESAGESAHKRAGAKADLGAGESAHERAGVKADAGADARAYKSAHERAGAGAHESAGESAHERAGAPSSQQLNFTAKEALIYEILKSLNGSETSQDRLARATDANYSYVRKIISRFRKLGILREQRAVRRGRKVISFHVTPVSYVCHDADAVMAKLKKIDLNCVMAFVQIDRSLIKKNLSICATEDDSADEKSGFDPECYPGLARIGFGPTQMRQVRRAWKALGLDLDGLPEALNRAEWMAKPENCHEIKNPLGYIVASLKNGMPSPPPGYKSRQELVAEALREKAEKIRKLQEQYFEDAFLVWWHELPEAEKQRIDRLNRAGAMWDTHRREYFRKNVFKPL
jgi:hypothetical protein